VVLTAVAAALVPAAPATTVTTEPSQPGPRPFLPAPPDHPDNGCTVPVAGGALLPCPPDRRPRTSVSCVVPAVDLAPGTTLVIPDCPRHAPSPGGRVVPVVPLSR